MQVIFELLNFYVIAGWGRGLLSVSARQETTILIYICKQKKLNYDAIAFVYDGQRVKASKTPLEVTSVDTFA